MKFVYIFSLIFLMSCQDVNRIEPPEGLIPENKMVDVLTELSLLNSAKNYNKRLMEQTGLQPDDYLYQKYNIDSIRLAESTRFYASDHETFERIYGQVKENLEELKTNYDLLAMEFQREKDSILEARKKGDTLKANPEKVNRRRLNDSVVIPPANRERPLQ